jgi:hypothetical protein
MDEEYGKPRDVDTDLAEITSRLGEPLATYRTNTRKVAWRFTLGVILLIIAAAAHYVFWSGEVPWPRQAHAWKFILIVLIGSPAAGSYLVYFAVRGMKLWVLEYPTGLFVWHRGRVLAFPWDEVRTIQFRGLPVKSATNRTDDTVWFDLERSGRRLFGTTLWLTRADGEQVAISSTLDGFPDLGRNTQEETYRRLFPEQLAAVRDGQTIAFGPIKCDENRITVGKHSLPWKEFGEIIRAGDKLEIKRAGKKKKRFSVCALHLVTNPHVLIGVTDAAQSREPIN